MSAPPLPEKWNLPGGDSGRNSPGVTEYQGAKREDQAAAPGDYFAQLGQENNALLTSAFTAKASLSASTTGQPTGTDQELLVADVAENCGCCGKYTGTSTTTALYDKTKTSLWSPTTGQPIRADQQLPGIDSAASCAVNCAACCAQFAAFSAAICASKYESTTNGTFRCAAHSAATCAASCAASCAALCE